jgi:hypothetical protein
MNTTVQGKGINISKNESMKQAPNPLVEMTTIRKIFDSRIQNSHLHSNCLRNSFLAVSQSTNFS